MKPDEIPTGDALAEADEERLAELLDEYVGALERGESPSIDAILADCPALAGVLPEYLEGVRAIHDAMAAPVTTPGGANEPTVAPRVLGDYELIRQIGRGGMGVVYEARQVSLNRRVALKVLPFAAVLDDRQVARFRTEAQAAASLHHPHIVPVFAVGQERGVHFYAMQFVDGRSLGQALDELRRGGTDGAVVAPSDATTLDGRAEDAALPTARSIRAASYFRSVAQLGVQAAEALQHAHEYGVVHRDIKPSNLLVDRVGKLWVTDFGLARVQTEVSVTRSGDVVGTLCYMSPEQARGRGDLVDGRTDVYSLGATLYEMLTLARAHSGDSPRAITQRIESKEPTPPRRLNPATPVDLETIVLRAMEKSRDDRYTTAQELADDLRRFLDGKPTVARRPSVLEQAGKWIARRRGEALGVAAALLVVTIVSVASAVWVAAAGRQTAAALEEAEANLDLAQSHYRQARAAVDHFGGDLADRLAELPGADRLRRELLADTLAYYDAFLRTADRDADLREDAAATHFKAGAIAHRLGELDAAGDSYARAIAAWRAAPEGDERERRENRSRLALGLRSLARVESESGRHDAASAHFDESIALATALVAEHPGDAGRVSVLAEALANRAMARLAAGRHDDGVAGLRRAIERFDEALRLDGERSADRRALAVAHSNLSNALRERSPDEARASGERAVAALERLVERRPEEAARRADLALAWNNLAALDGARGDWRGAAAGYRRAADEIDALVRRNPLLPRLRRESAITRSNLALALARLGEHAACDAEFDHAAETLRGLVEDFPNQPAYAASLAALDNNRGVALLAAGREDAALSAFEDAVAGQERAGALSPESNAAAAKSSRNYAAALRRAGRAEDAEAVEAARRQARTPSTDDRPRRTVTPDS